MERFVIALGEVSLAAFFIIAVLVLISPLLGRRYTAQWRYWVWAILAVRLILPFNFSMPVKIVEPTIPNREVITVTVTHAPRTEILSEEITCWPEIAERILDQRLTDPKENFWTLYSDGRFPFDRMMEEIGRCFEVEPVTVKAALGDRLSADGFVTLDRHKDLAPRLIWSSCPGDFRGSRSEEGDVFSYCFTRIQSFTREPDEDGYFLATFEVDYSKPMAYKVLSLEKIEPLETR